MREKKAQVGGFNIFPHSNHLLSPVCLCVLGGGVMSYLKARYTLPQGIKLWCWLIFSAWLGYGA